MHCGAPRNPGLRSFLASPRLGFVGLARNIFVARSTIPARAATRRLGGVKRADASRGRFVMVFKLLKYGTLTLLGGALAGAVLFGGEAISYLRSSARSVRSAMKDNIPMEFE